MRSGPQPTYKIVRVLVIAFGLIVAYPYIPGSKSAAFQGVSLFIGIVFSLGSSSAISNIIAGYMMTYRRAFKVGDRVKVGTPSARSSRCAFRSRTFGRSRTKRSSFRIRRFSPATSSTTARCRERRGSILHTEVGIGYETPWRQVEAMLIMAAERTSGLATDPRPFVLHKKLGDFAVAYELNVYCTNVPRMLQLYTALHRNILDVFNEYGVQIMTPAYETDPADPKLVRRQDWYAAPAPSADAAGVPASIAAAASSRDSHQLDRRAKA